MRNILCLCVFVILGCKDNTNSVCEKIFDKQNIDELEFQPLLKEAIWQVYKKNLEKGNELKSLDPFTPLPVDFPYKLSQYNLDFELIKNSKDTVEFFIILPNNLAPKNSNIFFSAVFWTEPDSIFLAGRFGHTFHRNDGEKEFEDFLQKNESLLSPMLLCLARERGVLKK